MSLNSKSIYPQRNLNFDKPNGQNIFYEFEQYRLDVAPLMLYKNGQPVSLAPKVVETLLALIERRGEIVGKEELMKRLWADSFVDEANLTQNMYLLRKTLGEGADGKPLVETFRRRGYCFNGSVKLIENGFDAAKAVNKQSPVEELQIGENRHFPAPATKPSRINLFSKPLVIVSAVVSGGLLLAALGGWFFFRAQKQNINAPPVSKSSLTLKRLTPNINTSNPAISSDGAYLAYRKVGGKEGDTLWLKNLATDKSVQLLSPIPKGYTWLQFSPDGKYLYYRTRRKQIPFNFVSRVPVSGVEPEIVAEDVFNRFALSPNGKRLAFVRGGNLVIAETDKSGERILAKRDGKARWFVSNDSQPSWSPDGGRIAICGGYLEQGRKYAELLEIDANTGAEKRLNIPNWSQLGTASYLPDGSGLLVTAREEANKPLQIWRLPYLDGAPTRITNDLQNYASLSLTADSRLLVTEQSVGRAYIWKASLSDTSQTEQLEFDGAESIGFAGLAFMPDGRIVYTSTRSGNVDLWMMNADGSNQKQLTANMGSWNGRPSVTPDGRYIVFQSFHQEKNQIWRINADGSNLTQLTTSNECCPSISSDGQWIYYSVDLGKPATIWKMSIDGGEPVQVSEHYLTTSPSISPDGKLVAYEHQDENSTDWKLAAMSAESGKTLRVFDAKTFRRTIGWTADSKSIIYIGRGTPNLWVQSVDGGTPTQLTNFNLEAIWGFTVSPDYQQLAVARGNTTGEAVLIENFR